MILTKKKLFWCTSRTKLSSYTDCRSLEYFDHRNVHFPLSTYLGGHKEKKRTLLCDTPLERQPLALRCVCFSTTMGFYDTLSGVGKEAYKEQRGFLLDQGFLSPNVTEDQYSCDVDNLNL